MELKLLILDFDDTLFPSTVYKKHKDENTDIDRQKIDQIDTIVCSLLSMYINRRYKVCIITNSEIQWVNMILYDYMRKLYNFSIFTSMTIISARDQYKDKTGDFIQWKIMAYQQYISDILSRQPQYKDVYVLSIGDSVIDMVATESLGKSQVVNMCNLSTKFIKYRDVPDIDILIYQLQYTSDNIDNPLFIAEPIPVKQITPQQQIIDTVLYDNYFPERQDMNTEEHHIIDINEGVSINRDLPKAEESSSLNTISDCIFFSKPTSMFFN